MASTATPAHHVKVGAVTFGNDLPLVLIAGPCQMESRAHALEVASALKKISVKAGVPLVYKTSFDKANRTSLKGIRGLGLKDSLPVFAEIRESLGVPVLTDIHEIETMRTGRQGCGCHANSCLPLPADGSVVGGRQDQGRGECKEGAVSRPVGHGQRCCQGEGHRQRAHSHHRARRVLRLQYSSHGYAQPADHGANGLSNRHGCDSCRAAARWPEHQFRGPTGVRAGDWPVRLYPWAWRRFSWKRIQTRTMRRPMGRI